MESDDGHRLVLKVSGAAESQDAVDLQVCLLEHVARSTCRGSAPVGVPARNGELYIEHQFADGQSSIVRLVTYLDGTPMPPEALLERQAVYNMGRLQGRISRALSGFFHPAARRPMPWDMSNGLAFDEDVLSTLNPHLVRLVEPHLQRLRDETLPALHLLRGQVIHNDVHPGNVLLGGDGEPSGLIDFGDALFAPLLQELASAAASIAEVCTSDCGDALAQLQRGFHDVYPLLPEERELFLDATLIRALLCVELVGFKATAGSNAEPQIAAHASAERALEVLLALRNTRTGNGAIPSDTAGLLERRKRVMSPTYHLHYQEPLNIVRADGTRLFDADGREYLDAYNNVPSVGHGNVHVAGVLARQSTILNTHTRYLHHEVVSYAERLIATLPDELDTCLFVCTGTEANDLAYNIARKVTGRRGAVVTDGAYHGNSIGIAELWPEGSATKEYPGHVAAIEPPDAYRGPLEANDPELGKKLAARRRFGHHGTR